MPLASKALQSSKYLQRFEFDDQTYTIRRNLMLVSSLALASTFVSPEKPGTYEINMGVIKGVVNNPELIYIFLAITCIYYLVWFYVHCQHAVVKNYRDIVHSFTEVLTKLHAQELFSDFTKNHTASFSGVPPFASKSVSIDSCKVAGELSNHAIRNYPTMERQLGEKSPFIVTKNSDGIVLEYTYEIKPDDLVYMNTHIDQYWRSRRKEQFVALLPIVYSSVCVLLVSWHVYGLFKS